MPRPTVAKPRGPRAPVVGGHHVGGNVPDIPAGHDRILGDPGPDVVVAKNIRTDGTYDHHPEYDALPECIKAMYSPKEYAWLGDDQRRTLIADCTLPEVGDDP